jgi:hypothetical protein
MMRGQVLAFLALVAVGVSASSALAVGPGMIQLAVSPIELPDGNWEYIYDVIGDSTPVVNLGLSGFDASAIVNQYSHSWGGYSGTLVQHWDFNAANNPPSYERSPYGSYSGDGTIWTLHGEPWSIENTWHTPDEYNATIGFDVFPKFTYPGQIAGDGQSLTYTSQNQNQPATGLLMTFRIVHPNAPDDIDWSIYSFYGSGTSSGTVLGPAPISPLVGDFNGDGDVDEDDVDMLCANMAGDVGTFDMDGDGDVDEDDMTFHVENHLEYDSDGDGIVDGTGTFRGDFNLDGIVNGTDLSIMSGGFGTTTGFAGGNANCDATVNGTDLSILSSVFGNVATAAIPEPLTIGLLSLGGVAILRRRSR